MKSVLTTLALVVATVASFAQGKINIMNDANHAVYFHNDNSLVPAAPNYFIDLYGYQGTSGGSFALLTSVPLNASLPGIFGPFNWTSTLVGRVASTFQVHFRDTLNPLIEAKSEIFTMVPGSGIAYNSLINTGGTALSTWANGTQAVPGGFGAIAFGMIPEPSGMVLAGLGAVSLLLFHRRRG